MTTPDHHRTASSPDDQSTQGHQRLWTPWRMQYVGGGAAEEGCIFCNRLAGDDDVASLIVHRGEHAFAMMNLFPYNTGHLMIVPNEHVASPEDASPESIAAVAGMLQPISRALRSALRPTGFNVGMNVGSVAGAGVADHLHMHVVPRWTGDANFMPILAATMVLPELIPVTYAKIRVEMERDLSEPGDLFSIALVVFDETAQHVLVRRRSDAFVLPSTTSQDDESMLTLVSRSLEAFGISATLTGWSGAGRAGDHPPALAFVTMTSSIRNQSEADADVTWIPVADGERLLPAEHAAFVRTAVTRHTPTLVAPPG